MAVNPSYLAFVLEQLQSLPAVGSRRMFGGVGLYSADVFFGLLDNDTLYFKVDDESVKEYQAAGSGPFRPYPDRPEQAMHGYYQVPASVLEDADGLARWARRAVAVGAASARAKRGRRRNTRRAPRRKPAR